MYNMPLFEDFDIFQTSNKWPKFYVFRENRSQNREVDMFH